MSSSSVLTSSGGYLYAIAHRGAFDVDPVLDRVPVLAVVVDVAEHLVEVEEYAHPVADRQPPGGQRGVGLRLPLGLEALARAEAVADHPQRAARGDARVLLPQ